MINCLFLSKVGGTRNGRRILFWYFNAQNRLESDRKRVGKYSPPTPRPCCSVSNNRIIFVFGLCYKHELRLCFGLNVLNWFRLVVLGDQCIEAQQQTYLLDVGRNSCFGVKVQSLNALNVLLLPLTLETEGRGAETQYNTLLQLYHKYSYIIIIVYKVDTPIPSHK